MMKFRTFDPTFSNPAAKSFDPGLNYQGAQLDGYNRQADLAQIDITITNAQASLVTVELFNFLRSVSEVYDGVNTTLNPATTENLVTLTGSNPKNINTNSLVYFDKAGSLIYENSSGAKCTVSCNQLPYRTLFKSSGVTPFRVENLRLTVQTDPQIDKQITWVRRTWLGAVEQNSISPRSYFNPNQFQTKTLDVSAAFAIDAETGLWYPVLAGETVTFNLFINAYNKNSI